jgi:broad specificity phosphatase PhoE
MRSFYCVSPSLCLGATLVAATLIASSCAAPSDQGAATVVFLVRHAEKADDGTDDPPLTQEGQARAASLAGLLRDAGLTHIHSTESRRTLETAAPLSDATGLPITAYDGQALGDLASRIRSMPGRHLVVGHSNTTPALVRILGGDDGGPIEDWEYDRFYVLTLRGDDAVTTVQLRLDVVP